MWTFAAGSFETDNDDDACPCDTNMYIKIPPYVESDYFCESGVSTSSTERFYPDDPLWDGKDCISSSTCCTLNNPPYFIKQLPRPTSDDIEARLCRLDGNNDDSPVEFIELYVKDSQSQADSISAKLDRLESKQDELSRKVIQELEQKVLQNITKELENELENINKYLHNSLGQMGGYVCGGTGGWRRVVCLDMTDTNTNCPSGWQLTSHSNKTTCGKAITSSYLVTQSSSLSVEEPIPVCVDLSELTSMDISILLRLIMKVE